MRFKSLPLQWWLLLLLQTNKYYYAITQYHVVDTHLNVYPLQPKKKIKKKKTCDEMMMMKMKHISHSTKSPQHYLIPITTPLHHFPLSNSSSFLLEPQLKSFFSHSKNTHSHLILQSIFYSFQFTFQTHSIVLFYNHFPQPQSYLVEQNFMHWFSLVDLFPHCCNFNLTIYPTTHII